MTAAECIMNGTQMKQGNQNTFSSHSLMPLQQNRRKSKETFIGNLSTSDTHMDSMDRETNNNMDTLHASLNQCSLNEGRGLHKPIPVSPKPERRAHIVNLRDGDRQERRDDNLAHSSDENISEQMRCIFAENTEKYRRGSKEKTNDHVNHKPDEKKEERLNYLEDTVTYNRGKNSIEEKVTKHPEQEIADNHMRHSISMPVILTNSRRISKPVSPLSSPTLTNRFELSDNRSPFNSPCSSPSPRRKTIDITKSQMYKDIYAHNLRSYSTILSKVSKYDMSSFAIH